jgi:hypothetical protein
MIKAIKPCPWCGKPAQLYRAEDCENFTITSNLFFVGCVNEDCAVVSSTRGHANDESAAVTAWNDRHVSLIIQ